MRQPLVHWVALCLLITYGTFASAGAISQQEMKRLGEQEGKIIQEFKRSKELEEKRESLQKYKLLLESFLDKYDGSLEGLSDTQFFLTNAQKLGVLEIIQIDGYDPNKCENYKRKVLVYFDPKYSNLKHLPLAVLETLELLCKNSK